MIFTMTLNPSIDYVLRLNNLVIGETNRSFYEAKIPGGKGIMVSKLLNSLNIKSINIGFIGGFTGEFIEESLEKIGIKTKFTRIKDDTRINVKLKDKLETEINARGPEIKEDEIKELFKILNEIEKEDVVVLSGSIPHSLNECFYEDIIKELQKKNINFVIDTTGEKLLKVLKYNPVLIKPNKEELEELFGIKINSLTEIEPYAKKLIEMGAKNVIVSLGKEGAMYFNKDFSLYAPVVQGKLINSVGAGDSMIGGFLYGIENKLSKKECFKWAVSSGTATAFSEDIGSKEFIEEIYKKVVINNL
nr:1-phosphofructokinase [Miniphocaeibacter massiliensis]